MKKRVLTLLLAMILLLAACAGKKENDSSNKTSSLPGSSSAVVPVVAADPSINPLTGEPRPATMAADARPVAVMVANNEMALPQRGLAAADVMYEMLTEGGVTRLMAVYADYTTMPQVGPVRSTRDQFVQMAVPENILIAHIGSSVYASNLLELLQYKTLDGYYLGKNAYIYDTARIHPKPNGKPNEYNWFTDAAMLQQGMGTAEVSTTGVVPALFNFGQSAPAKQEATQVGVTYSDISASGFDYNAKDGVYYKNIMVAGAMTPHMDEDGSRLSYKNVILLQCEITDKQDGVSQDFNFGAGGTGFYVTAGGMQEIRWEKQDIDQPLRLLDSAGKELQVQPGKSYIGVLPAGDATDNITFGTVA